MLTKVKNKLIIIVIILGVVGVLYFILINKPNEKIETGNNSSVETIILNGNHVKENVAINTAIKDVPITIVGNEKIEVNFYFSEEDFLEEIVFKISVNYNSYYSDEELNEEIKYVGNGIAVENTLKNIIANDTIHTIREYENICENSAYYCSASGTESISVEIKVDNKLETYNVEILEDFNWPKDIFQYLFESNREDIINYFNDENFDSDNMSVVPDVSNLTLDEAKKILEEKGFVIAGTEKINEQTISEGLVVKTDPAAGLERLKGYEITLYLSYNDSDIIVENYIGLDYLNVKANLETKGIIVIVEKIDYNDDSSNNTIVNQSILAGESITEGEIITLYIGK